MITKKHETTSTAAAQANDGVAPNPTMIDMPALKRVLAEFRKELVNCGQIPPHKS